MIKLKEVLWEITLNCNKNCKYCGSKKLLNSETHITLNDLYKVAQQLIDYKVEEVTLTGGEPGTLPENVLFDIVAMLHANRIKVKVVTNGLFLNHKSIISSMTAIGVSVNTSEDVDNINKEKFKAYRKCVMITNFGTHNVWDFSKLYECSTNFALWQVQLTMGEYQLDQEGISYLLTKFDDIISKDRFIFADNFQEEHTCTAGLRSCGILANGNVVACLSERSYNENMKIYGNVFHKTLQEIWESEFKDIRFECTRKCCRDFINFPKKSKALRAIEDAIKQAKNPIKTIWDNFPWTSPKGIQMYAVTEPKFDDQITYIYGVGAMRKTTGDKIDE